VQAEGETADQAAAKAQDLSASADLSSQLTLTSVGDLQQAAAQAAGETADLAAAEAQDLSADADLPLEELLARYGMVVGREVAKPAADGAAAASPEDAPPPAKRPRRGEPVDTAETAPVPAAPAPAVTDGAVSDAMPEAGVAAAAIEPQHESDLGALWDEANSEDGAGKYPDLTRVLRVHFEHGRGCKARSADAPASSGCSGHLSMSQFASLG